MEVELLVHNQTQLGEGPVWDHRTSILYWVDIEQGHIQAYDHQSRINQVYPMGEFVGAAVPTIDGRLIVGLKSKVIIFDPSTGAQELVCEPEPGEHSNRFNDGKCDRRGRFWIGSTQVDHKDPTGALYAIGSGGTFSPKLKHLTISNGMAWSADDRIMYFIDSPTMAVQRFHYQSLTGEIEPLDEVVRFTSDAGVPDGMTIDNQGNLWIAFYGAGRVGCYHPTSGQQLISISVPAKNTTSCCFGGPAMDELFITTARRDDPEGGGLYRCKPGVSGPRAQFFKNEDR